MGYLPLWLAGCFIAHLGFCGQAGEALQGTFQIPVCLGYLPISTISVEALCNTAGTISSACFLHTEISGQVLHKLLYLLFHAALVHNSGFPVFDSLS